MLVDNTLFATLDPTVRRCRGVRRPRRTRWPTPLASFGTYPRSWWRPSARRSRRSAEADLILHVVDAADADPEAQIRAVREVFGDIDALGVPEQIVFNKIDVADPDMLQRLRRLAPDAAFVSARTGVGVDKLQAILEDPAASAGR